MISLLKNIIGVYILDNFFLYFEMLRRLKFLSMFLFIINSFLIIWKYGIICIEMYW